MEGEAHWLTGALILGGGLLILVLMRIASRSGGRLVSQRRRVVCPTKNNTFECLVTHNVDGDLDTDIESCSAFDPPGIVPCDKACLRHRSPQSAA